MTGNLFFSPDSVDTCHARMQAYLTHLLTRSRTGIKIPIPKLMTEKMTRRKRMKKLKEKRMTRKKRKPVRTRSIYTC